MSARDSWLVGVSGLFATWLFALSPSHTIAAQWLAPAAEERITADWVKDVARALRKDRFKNVFMNQPFGCDQCRVIEFLNHAADALENDNPKLAKSFVQRALNVFENGLDRGWYEEADIRPIKRLIVTKANQGFKEAGEQPAMSSPRELGDDPRYNHGRPPLFSRSDESDEYGSRADRWSGYTSPRRLGLSNEPPDRDGRDQDPDSEASGEFSDRGRQSSARKSRSQQDRQDRMSNRDRGSQDMSQERWREFNERDFDNTYDAAQALKETADAQYKHNPMISSRQGRVRQSGD